jgi:hypothetical protein
MSRHRLCVVLAQAQGRNPANRALEECIVAALILEGGLDVSVVPHLNDLDAAHTGRLFLESVTGDMAILSWLDPRSCYRLLDRYGIKGRYVAGQLPPAAAEDTEEEVSEPESPKVTGSTDVPDRAVYCLDLHSFNNHELYVAEVRRIALECRQRRLSAPPGQAIMVQLGVSSSAGEPVADESHTPESSGTNDAIQEGEQMLSLKSQDGVVIPKRRVQEVQEPKDDLDRLLDSLDSLDI